MVDDSKTKDGLTDIIWLDKLSLTKRGNWIYSWECEQIIDESNTIVKKSYSYWKYDTINKKVQLTKLVLWDKNRGWRNIDGNGKWDSIIPGTLGEYIASVIDNYVKTTHNP